eukprot:CAMPEP_0115441382 /NCGR_PEP_ID=MMETSP0271-20121206/36798_1 /TAXON_ID=71861 /ORGANISM="Scrippsiella trochoidea, Strain CCMP3099" /LENGTH=37 /DNA_ID= /DNA_START= /DNA_END= /DNA_ORIENTATION=
MTLRSFLGIKTMAASWRKLACGWVPSCRGTGGGSSRL